MKVSVFTSNQPRHLSLIRRLAEISEEVFAIQECNTIFPGAVEDFFAKSEIMQRYFSKVIEAEKKVFGPVNFNAPNVSSLSIKSGDLSMVDLAVLEKALDADLMIIFGASWIRGPLIEQLVSHRAINIHMGVSPFYRGSSCNFWALYDGNPDLVGSTIHRLGRGLDSGGIYFHAMPKPTSADPFEFGMTAVHAAHMGLIESIADGSIFEMDEVPQQSDLEIRYTRNADFSEKIAEEYLDRAVSAEHIGQSLRNAGERDLVDPKYY